MPLGPHLTWHQEETGYDTQLGGGGEAVSFGGFPVSAPFVCGCGAQATCALPPTLLTVGTWMFR